jgi:hypothetical protein
MTPEQMRDASRSASAADHSHPTLEQEVEEVERTERAIQQSQREAVKSQNLFNLLMVTTTALMAIATVFSAWASWRMARVAENLFQASERPYVGVASLRLDISDQQKPATWVEFRDFGNVPADLVAIDISTWVDGQAVPGGLGKPHLVMSLGLLAPNAPCYLAAIFPPKYMSAVKNGASKTVVSVRTSYKDATGRLYCFHMNYMYYAPLRKYDPEGGGTDCTPDAPTYSEATTLERQMSSGNL